MREINVTYSTQRNRNETEFVKTTGRIFLTPSVKIQNANNIGGIVPEHMD